ncbi:AraC family transcriptional regulator [Colwellia sp. 1_MG-2023]|uniref:AraC family transcriptional regulator n=1 Tax=unclassified Colwellia TaxID=196834 RepID=UPI001C098589|nr:MULTISPECIES: AraC family transcriptional regulator [unclassified Colwellia]MBU2923349.1 AraC family transcriptional regulator [Colwellia sp. C2M11]MDO6653664.1 AraC family transcriptional regulator [Colwellia sp. 3_MG-2023]MDO6666475.1 AraC family transcriptional regulator [Colwellia sp. 2_MG-2023]MDO6690890.1 AraC family transcriptional regulator [Colwellia sp. 1_MG-2023]
MDDNVINEMKSIIDRYSLCDGIHATKIEGLHFYKMSSLNVRLPVIYRPSIYVVVQGCKQVSLNGEVFQYTNSKYLVVSVDLPLIGEVTSANKDKPYLCIQIDIDMKTMAKLVAELNLKASHKTGKGIFVGNMDEVLGEPILRLMKLLDAPKDIPYLSGVYFLEIYYRLLNTPHGSSIIQTSLHGSNMYRVAKVIEIMKLDIAKPRSIDELAAMINMSTSNFYNQFKKVTGLSPLQYLKQLRLTEARQIMISHNTNATKTAYMVGYESPSQFSREYTRLFGASPRRDIKAFRK